MSWWTEVYKGGPMVAVEGFPRPMYPPDAKKYGKTPSSDGPDVVAYKRVVSRAGRWPWQPFDDTFSNTFSHGKSGNVGETGVAGVQRQQHLDATGWIGVKMFNTLRSIRVPEGLPNAGEMCMDAEAVRLINQAFRKFRGNEPVVGGGVVRKAALERAKTQIGIAESPAGSNNVIYGRWYGMNGVPWCAEFATWCYELAAQSMGKNSPSFVKGSKYAYVPYIVADARAKRNGLVTTDDPIPGDLVCFDWERDSVYDHVGLFEKWIHAGVDFSAIEGNTSNSSNSNGGQVMRRARSRPGVVFVRVKEPA